MGLRKPSLSVTEARRLSGAAAPANVSLPAPPEPEDPKPVVPAAVPEPEVPVAVPEPEAAVADPAPVAPPSPAKAAGRQAPVEKPAPAPRRFAPPALPALPESQVKLQVFLSALQPAPGVSPSFDMLSQRYPAAKSLQMILRRALDEYEHMIADGTFVGLAGTYEPDPQAHLRPPVHTSRIMAQALIERARKHFDPLGFESARAFGFKLATAALAAFFTEEARLRRR
jgi:hypothetical protein